MEIIKVGTYNSKISVARTKKALRVLSGKYRNLDFDLVLIHGKDSSDESEEIKLLTKALIDGIIDIAVSDVRIIKKYSTECVTMSGIVGRGDPRNVIISNKNVKEYEGESVVELREQGNSYQVEKLYDNVRCEYNSSAIFKLLSHVKKQICHAAVISADAVKLLGMNKDRSFNYAYLDTRQMVPYAGQAMMGIITLKDSAFSRPFRKMSDSVTIKEYKIEKQITERFSDSSLIVRESLAVCVMIKNTSVNIELYAKISRNGFENHYRDSQRGLADELELCKRRIIDNFERELSM